MIKKSDGSGQHISINVRHGYGINKWESGAVYEGEWQDNKSHGKGIFWHSTGEIYIGQFS